jgi:hypothetical protein
VDSDYRLHGSARPRTRRVSTAEHARRAVVILRQPSNFGGATFSGVYFDRGCPRHFHPDAIADAGGAQLQRRDRKQATKAIPGSV